MTRPRAFVVVGVLVFCSGDSAHAATLPVTTTADAIAVDGACSLREAFANANDDLGGAAAGECPAGSGADLITVPAGTFTLTSALSAVSAVSVRGAGRDATVLRNPGGRILTIGGPSPAVTLRAMTLRDAQSPGGNDGGPAFGSNGGVGQDGSPAVGGGGGDGGSGGAVANTAGGTLTVEDCRFVNNRAFAGGPGGAATAGHGGTGGAGAQANGGPGGPGGSGGAVASVGPVVVRDCQFEANRAGDGGTGGAATGGDGGNASTSTGVGRVGGSGYGGAGGIGGSGGAIFSLGALTVERSQFVGNYGGGGGAGGLGQGGEGGTGGTTSGANGSAGGGYGGAGGSAGGGGAVGAQGPSVSILQSTFRGSFLLHPGTGGKGIGGRGGTGYVGVNSTGGFGGSGTGGAGGHGGAGMAIRALAPTTITASLLANQGAFSGYGGAGGEGEGNSGGFGGGASGVGGTGGSGTGGTGGNGSTGTIFVAGNLTLTNTTTHANSANDGGVGGTGRRGSGGTGGGGNGSPGTGTHGAGGNGGHGLADVNGTITVLSSTLSASSAGFPGPGGSGFSQPAGASGLPGIHTLRAGGGGTVTATLLLGPVVGCSGTITDGGFTKTASASCPGAVVASPLTGTSLGDFGGPTQTLGLLGGTSAVDTVPAGPACPATDQRGISRPKGGGCDVGAYERAAPDVTTEAADGLAETSATLHATVNPNGHDTTVRFAYGTSTNYGSKTPEQAVGGGLTASAPTAALSALAPGTTYHYRVEASSPDGESVGADRTFTTPATAGVGAGPGAAGPGAGGGLGDVVAPVFTAASVSPPTFAVNRRGAREVAVPAAARRGTRLRWTLSEAARVVVAITRELPGRRVGTRCAKPTRTNARRKRCTRLSLVGRFAVVAKAGTTTKAFSGRIGKKTLRPGRHRATLVARDAAGNISRAKVLRFRVVRR